MMLFRVPALQRVKSSGSPFAGTMREPGEESIDDEVIHGGPSNANERGVVVASAPSAASATVVIVSS